MGDTQVSPAQQVWITQSKVHRTTSLKADLMVVLTFSPTVTGEAETGDL